MKKCFVFFVLMMAMFFTNVSAESGWVTMEETPKSMYQIDRQTIKFIGNDTDRSVELWLKIVEKDQPDFYRLVHFIVRENGLIYMKKEESKYAISGEVIASTDGSTSGWSPLPANSVLGRIATHLLSEYRDSQASAAITDITVNPLEVQKALKDEHIKQKIEKNGTKKFYVHYSKMPGLLSTASQGVIADFCLTVDGNNKRFNTLKFTMKYFMSGCHSVNQSLIISVDGKDWLLAPPLSFESNGDGCAAFTMVFKIPNALISALAVTKNPVVLKWKHNYNNAWEDCNRKIPENIVHDIQLMYIGCN